MLGDDQVIGFGVKFICKLQNLKFPDVLLHHDFRLFLDLILAIAFSNFCSFDIIVKIVLLDGENLAFVFS